MTILSNNLKELIRMNKLSVQPSIIYKVIINFIFKNKKKKVYLNQNLVISLLIRTHQKDVSSSKN